VAQAAGGAGASALISLLRHQSAKTRLIQTKKGEPAPRAPFSAYYSESSGHAVSALTLWYSTASRPEPISPAAFLTHEPRASALRS
jgi:hypothetical protein